jgi:pyruvate dehydrogenase E2 component (dihydrolipoyllysine-residue acetyltransferase)
MPFELRMPSLGMTMDEGKVVAWRVKVGDRVARGQILLDIESEKVAYEVECPADGIVGELLVPVEAVVPVGTPLVSILTADEAPQPPPARPRTRLSPRARRLAETLGVDPETLVGTGPDGTVVEQDIRAAAGRAAESPPARAATADIAPGSTLHPFSSMRRTIADRMTRSAHEAPHFFLAVEVDGAALLDYRREHRARLNAETGITLTVTDLLVRITALVLGAHRALNATYSSDGLRQWDSVNLGLAVAVEGGLIVPVIRDAERQAIADVMRIRHDLVARARARKLRAEELEGGTFTVSNLGGLGIDFFTSILNPPEAGILSIGSLRDRPAVVDGRVVARPRMIVGLTIDHRVTDGAAGAAFLQDFKARVETGRLDH